ncbi:MAG: hypothetical protein WDO70_08490 [Alphaproteobacteria bacterium]
MADKFLGVILPRAVIGMIGWVTFLGGPQRKLTHLLTPSKEVPAQLAQAPAPQAVDTKMQNAVDYIAAQSKGGGMHLAEGDLDVPAAAYLIRTNDAWLRQGLSRTRPGYAELRQRFAPLFQAADIELARQGYQAGPRPIAALTRADLANMSGAFGGTNNLAGKDAEKMTRIMMYAEEKIHDREAKLAPGDLDARGILYLLNRAYDGTKEGRYSNDLNGAIWDIEAKASPAYKEAEKMSCILDYADSRLRGEDASVNAADMNARTALALTRLSVAVTKIYGEDNGLTKAMPELRKKFPHVFRAADAMAAREAPLASASGAPARPVHVPRLASAHKADPHI